MKDLVVERLDRLIKLVLFGITRDGTQAERIRLLASVGCGPKEIAETLGTTANTVNQTLVKQRKSQKRGPA
jgi:hypothetical protein